MSESLRAVVIGASGIGKHHVKWLMRAGCEVVGFLGTSPESVARTAAALRETLGFEGTGYSSLAELIGRCRPQIASVASPMALHYEHVLACLGAGAEVLCEKPLTGGPTLSTDDQLFLANKLVEAADRAGRLLAANTQYAAAAPHLLALCRDTTTEPVVEFFMQMESRGQRRTGGYEEIWHDLAPHPISVLLALVPDGQVDWSSVRCVLASQRNECTFDFVPPDGPVCKAGILLRNVPEGPLSRRFSLNGVSVLYEGRNDEHGVYCAYLTRGGTELKAKDFMEESITRFAAAAAACRSGIRDTEPLADGRTGLRNLELQLRLIERAERC